MPERYGEEGLGSGEDPTPANNKRRTMSLPETAPKAMWDGKEENIVV